MGNQITFKAEMYQKCTARPLSFPMCIGVEVFVAPVRTGHRPQYVTDGNLPTNYAFSTLLEKMVERYKP